ncbi:gamma-2-syntrophin-like isoform X2 [Lineus longissimus]|uniref:gamma-2-syntrophin-like isoform X2 n=1 Tax=Lineus longissimus TaxID=88925 RepID=UPI00315DCD70
MQAYKTGLKMQKQGMVLLTDGKTKPQPVRLQLTEETLTIQKEELVYVHSASDDLDNSGITRERVITIRRERVGGLGLSIKGGQEHHLPILISRIFKDQAADRNGKLFVGDAIIKVNNVSVEKTTHDVAVQALKEAGEEVALTVKHFRPASLFLSRNRNSGGPPAEDDGRNKVPPGYNTLPKLEKHWADMQSIPLQFAHLTRYNLGSDKIRQNGFEVRSMEGLSSGVIHCENSNEITDWLRCINNNISALNNHSMTMSNRLLLPNDQIVHMCWTSEKLLRSKPYQNWKSQFVALRGANVYFFDAPPASTRDWLRCDEICKVYESMFRILRDTELLDDRQHCFLVQGGSGDSHYLSLEGRQAMLRFEKAWYRTNYLAVMHLKNKTFGCTWRGRISGLTLDLNTGFSLYDSESRCYMWSYKFSQLKGSSDDGKTKLKLHFTKDPQGTDVDTREIECTNLQTLLFSMHAFLSAKLASVDPSFLRNF